VTSTELWEILVPTVRPGGRPIRTRFHRVWDEKVRAIAGGLTICAPAKGTWTAPSGEIFRERMIPVRIACTETQARAIAIMTADYYEQQAVLVYRVSDRCFIIDRGEQA
jgi:hypothetical protein